MSTQVFEYVGLYPIPVGHRIEIKLFSRPEGVFKRTNELQPHEPQITDLDTGIVYGHHWHHADLASLRRWTPAELSSGIRGDLEIEWSGQGTVVACRVVWLSMGETFFPQTTLKVSLA